MVCPYFESSHAADALMFRYGGNDIWLSLRCFEELQGRGINPADAKITFVFENEGTCIEDPTVHSVSGIMARETPTPY